MGKVLLSLVLSMLVGTMIFGMIGMASAVEGCAKEGEQYSPVYTNEYPSTCCEGLEEWDSGMDTRRVENGKCVETGLESGNPVGTCLACGNGICDVKENVCNCPKDCNTSVVGSCAKEGELCGGIAGVICCGPNVCEYDGDTFKVYSGETIRLICIDTPEKGEIGYQEAKDYLSLLILNKEVVLEGDLEDLDSYGRSLRYVYSDGVFVNREMVKEGYAEVFRYGKDTIKCDEIEGL